MRSFACGVFLWSMTAMALLCQGAGNGGSLPEIPPGALASTDLRAGPENLPLGTQFVGMYPRENFFLAANRAARAQEESGKAEEKEKIDPKTTTRVTLGSSSGTPGTSVVVPIYFTPAEGVEVGRLKLDVNFVSANLKFSKIDRGIAAELGNVDLSTDLKVGKNEQGVETSTLTIMASFLSPEPPQKGIPAGLLGYLTLRIDENGRPASISLRTSAEGAELGSNKPLQNLRAFEAKVDVLAPGSQPMITCFIFTH